MMSDPVQKVEASEANQAIDPLNSWTFPNRPNGLELAQTSPCAGSTSSRARVILVEMCPGERELTRIPSTPSSQAIDRAIWMTAALEVLYATHLE